MRRALAILAMVAFVVSAAYMYMEAFWAYDGKYLELQMRFIKGHAAKKMNGVLKVSGYLEKGKKAFSYKIWISDEAYKDELGPAVAYVKIALDAEKYKAMGYDRMKVYLNFYPEGVEPTKRLRRWFILKFDGDCAGKAW